MPITSHMLLYAIWSSKQGKATDSHVLYFAIGASEQKENNIMKTENESNFLDKLINSTMFDIEPSHISHDAQRCIHRHTKRQWICGDILLIKCKQWKDTILSDAHFYLICNWFIKTALGKSAFLRKHDIFLSTFISSSPPWWLAFSNN